MPSTMVQSLSRATTATFEELALLFPEHQLTDEQTAAPLGLAVSVDFRGPFNGRLVLEVSTSILPLAASNMLGEHEGKQPQLQRDALGELANVICGNVLPAIAGQEAVFHLSAPKVHEDATAVSREHDAAQARTEFGVEDGRARVALYVFGDAEAMLAVTGA